VSAGASFGSISRAEQAPSRTFLFLQGHPSRFARELAAALEQRGHRIMRINFCAGDVIFGWGSPAIAYRGSFSKWPDYLAGLVQREHVTDIVYYADCRPYHRTARDVADRLGVNAYTYEFGYLRPDWLTLERGGMSANSHFPDNPATIRTIGRNFPKPDLGLRYRYAMAHELALEMTYHFSSYFLFFLFPRYEADRYYNPLYEYLRGIPRQLAATGNARHANRVIEDTLGSTSPYFVFPLQLQCDYQLRRNARYAHQSEAIAEVIASFSKRAPPDARLIFKCHPLDNGAERWPRHIDAAAATHGTTDRIAYIDGGDLSKLLRRTSGVVTINSTVGLLALITHRPVKVLGTAVFDLEGATHRGPLDEFWRAPTRPDPTLVDALVRALAGTTQVRGSFFDAEGRAAAVAVFADRLSEGDVNGAGAYVTPPPRQGRQR